MNCGTLYSPRVSSFQDKNSCYLLEKEKSFFLIWKLNDFKKFFWYFSFIKYSKVFPELQQYLSIKPGAIPGNWHRAPRTGYTKIKQYMRTSVITQRYSVQERSAMLVNNLKITNATLNRSQSKDTMTIAKNGFIPCSPLNTVRIRLPESLLLLASTEDLKQSLIVFT